MEVEATDYLLKPLRPDPLRVAVERARRRRNAAAALRDGPAAAPSTAALRVPGAHGGSRDLPFGDVLWVEAARD